MPRKTRRSRPDLQTTQPVRTATGQPYGQASELARAQQAVPLPAFPDLLDLARRTPPEPPITAPTQRPTEPITAGLSSGAGPGPEMLPASGFSPLDELRAMYRNAPFEELRQLIEYAEMNP